MKTILKIFAFLLLFIHQGCEGDTTDENNQDTDNVVIIETDITGFTTWYGDSVYLIKKYDFYVENTLVIEPGTVIKFHPDEGPYMMLGGSGTIVANGTNDDPVVFTSFKDDLHGGDVNGDGDATSPAPKDWGGINTNGMNGSVFNYCEFYYGGSTSYNATLTLYGDNIEVTNCKFIYNDGGYTSSAGDIGVLDASDAGTGTLIKDNIFYGNKRPLSMSLAFNIDDSNIFHNPVAASETNQYNGIFVESINHITAPIQWGETEVPFVIDDNDFWINSGASLTLSNNVVLKFKNGSVLLLRDGASALINHDGPGVFFTSYKDDAQKGDTNGDGNATAPSENDWEGIYDDSMVTPHPYFFTWSNILYDSY